MESERIAILETKVDALTEILARIEASVDTITAKQLEMGITVKVAHNLGKLFLSVVGALLGYAHWDQVIAFLHQVSTPKQ